MKKSLRGIISKILIIPITISLAVNIPAATMLAYADREYEQTIIETPPDKPILDSDGTTGPTQGVGKSGESINTGDVGEALIERSYGSYTVPSDSSASSVGVGTDTYKITNSPEAQQAVEDRANIVTQIANDSTRSAAKNTIGGASSSIVAQPPVYPTRYKEIGESFTITLNGQSYGPVVIPREMVEYNSRMENGVQITDKNYPPETIAYILGTADPSGKLMQAWISEQGSFRMESDSIVSISLDAAKTWSGFIGLDPTTGLFTMMADPRFSGTAGMMQYVLNLSAAMTGCFDESVLSNLLNGFNWRNKDVFLTMFDKIIQFTNGDLSLLTMEQLLALLKEGLIPPEELPPGMTPPGGKDPSGNPEDELINKTTVQDYLYTYNDSRNYEEDGHHAGFSDEEGTRDGKSNPNGVNGMIIPSDEKYVNGITDTPTRGQMAIGMRRVHHVFDIDYEYKYEKTFCKIVRKNFFKISDGNNTWESEDAPGEEGLDVVGTVERPVPEPFAHRSWGTPRNYHGCDYTVSRVHGQQGRYSYYVYLYDLDIQDFNTATIYNDTFTNDTETYNNTDDHTRKEIPANLDSPVDDIGGYGPIIHERPTYNVKALLEAGTKEWNNSGGSDASKQAIMVGSFKPSDDEHLKWAEWNDDALRDAHGYLSVGERAAIHTFGEGESIPDLEGFLDKSWAEDLALIKTAELVGDAKDNPTKLSSFGGGMEGVRYFSKATNDLLEIGYDATMVLDGEELEATYYGSSKSWSDAYVARNAAAIPPYLEPTVNAALDAMNKICNTPETETYEASPAFGKAQEHIPADQKNGEYPTEVQSTGYKSVMITRTLKDAAAASETDIKPGYTHNEPVIVQTPVVSPVELYDEDASGGHSGSERLISAKEKAGGETGKSKETQHYGTTAADGRNPELTQLRLDETYYFKFNPREHLQTQGYANIDKTSGDMFDNTWKDSDIKFDKYTKAKYVHFPFDVCVYMHDGDDKPVYYAHTDVGEDDDDSNYWIKIYDKDDPSTKKNLEWTRFYIPSWAMEGSYPDGEGIKYKVESINVIDSEGDDHRYDPNAMNDELNDIGSDVVPDKELYIATYEFNVQLSGWVYDFQVVGTNLRDLYDRDLSAGDAQVWHSLYYSFATNKEEKKTGVLNRLGGDSRYTELAKNVRYAKDGNIAINGSGQPQWDPKDTITVDATKSHKYENNSGTPPKGTEFAFSVKTISNLWNPNDYLEIKPTFWYMSDDGTKYVLDPASGTESEEHGKLHIYYNDYSTDEKKTLIEYGSTDDKNLVKEVYLGQEMFNDSYFKVDLTRSARYPIADDPVVDEVMHFTPSYGTSKTDDSVNSEFLSKRVDSFTLSRILIPSGLRLFTGKVDLLKKNLDRNRTANPADSTRPTVLGLTDMYEYPAGNAAATQNLLEHSMQEWYGNYIIPSEIFLTPLTRQELEEYAGEHGLKRDDPNVFLQNGYLVVHFDIRTHNSADPRKDLRYSGDDPAAQNMWRDQTTKKSNDQQVTVGSPGATGHHEPKSISVNYGDVFIIDNSTSIDDWFGAHIWTMN